MHRLGSMLFTLIQAVLLLFFLRIVNCVYHCDVFIISLCFNKNYSFHILFYKRTGKHTRSVANVHKRSVITGNAAYFNINHVNLHRTVTVIA